MRSKLKRIEAKKKKGAMPRVSFFLWGSAWPGLVSGSEGRGETAGEWGLEVPPSTFMSETGRRCSSPRFSASKMAAIDCVPYSPGASTPSLAMADPA
jgi:hypothetical protein